MQVINQALAGQKSYYQLRAKEYDQWWYRQGRYDRGSNANAIWFEEAHQVKIALSQFSLEGHILELASGTGIWTETLTEKAISITAVDASPEMISINQAKVRSAKVQYLVADLFEWEPAQSYDAVFFSFWLSHVPRERLDTFLHKVNACLRPGGKLFFLDGLRQETSTANDHQLPLEDSQIMSRKLNDGQSFSIIKVFYSADELQKAFEAAGLLITIHQTPTYFYYGLGFKPESISQ
ncbi:MAG: class I SAM-dependent methyltransferase [Pedobacter sp.]|nr:MAG: class I SAM-dependent methyltransferase [Pedobacter sp.]